MWETMLKLEIRGLRPSEWNQHGLPHVGRALSLRYAQEETRIKNVTCRIDVMALH